MRLDIHVPFQLLSRRNRNCDLSSRNMPKTHGSNYH
jgi:hypothetical protein